MSKIFPATATVIGNEKATAFCEVNQRSNVDKKTHRYQIIYVMRDGRESEFRRDMGLVSQFPGTRQLNIPSLMEHTVDELMDLADELRPTVNIDLMDWLQLEKAKFK